MPAGIIDAALEASVAGIRAVKISLVALLAETIHNFSDALTAIPLWPATSRCAALVDPQPISHVGVLAGFPLADPLVGIAVSVAILAVLRAAALDIGRRLMDGVDPALVESAEAALAGGPGVIVDPDLSVVEGHHIAVAAHHDLLHHVPDCSRPPCTSAPPEPQASSSTRSWTAATDHRGLGQDVLVAVPEHEKQAGPLQREPVSPSATGDLDGGGLRRAVVLPSTTTLGRHDESSARETPRLPPWLPRASRSMTCVRPSPAWEISSRGPACGA